ncbi:patatin-like phospholipase family protein [Luteolibacter sp. AS25]|uniref:patatin-like phospholipase family protein n=1 Tax=Luteolibacter sp. AS25 TaxID=3135776 RepID=UPI00398B76B9
MNEDPGIAVALGSAFLGVYAHSGFLCGLNKAGIFPAHIAGSSAGAIAGGLYAAGLRDGELQKAALSSELKSSYFDPYFAFRSAPMGVGILTGLLSGKRTISHLEELLPVHNIEDCQNASLHIAVTEFRGNRAEFLTNGPLAKSIMASCAVPILFLEQEISGKKYHDGGILHELPIAPFVENPDIHTIIVHDVAYPKATNMKKLRIGSIFGSSHRMMNQELFAFRRLEAERNGKKVILLQTNHPHPGLLQSAGKKLQFFQAGESTAQKITV